MVIDEGLPVASGEIVQHRLRRRFALLHGYRRQPGKRLPVLMQEDTGVADGESLAVTGERKVLPDHHPTAAVDLDTESLVERSGFHTTTPDDCRRRNKLSTEMD